MNCLIVLEMLAKLKFNTTQKIYFYINSGYVSVYSSLLLAVLTTVVRV